MKNDKFCFNRTLAYLVLLVIVVAGFFWVMGKANTNTASNAKAASKGYDCMYGGNVLTASSTPYSIETAPRQCIIVTNTGGSGTPVVNTGYRCVTDLDPNSPTFGQRVGPGNKKDLTNCPLPVAAAASDCMLGGQTLKAQGFSTDTKSCVIDAVGGWTGYYCNPTTFLTKYDLTTCPVPGRTECSLGGLKLSEFSPPYTADRTTGCILTGAGGWTGYHCNPNSKLTNYDLATCPSPTAAPRAACTMSADNSLDSGNCLIVTKTGAHTGYYCDPTTFMVNYNLTKCPAAVRTACSYGGATATLDTNNCVTYKGAWTGYYCDPKSFMTNYNLNKCPTPAAAARTECSIGGNPLSSYKNSAGTGPRYTVEAGTGCILDADSGGYNNGYKCSNSPDFMTTYDIKACPL